MLVNVCCCDFAWGRVTVPAPATAANCILTDYQHEAVNHQPREREGKRVRGCFQQIEMEKMMKSETKQRKGVGGDENEKREKTQAGDLFLLGPIKHHYADG